MKKLLIGLVIVGLFIGSVIYVGYSIKNKDNEDVACDIDYSKFGMTQKEFEEVLASKGMTLEDYCESINDKEYDKHYPKK